MNKKKSTALISIFSFLISAVYTSVCYIAKNKYIAFAETVTGKYTVAYVNGEPLRCFIIKAALIATGLIGFVIFLICILRNSKKTLFPCFTLISGIGFTLCTATSAYTVSRFAGYTLVQDYTGISVVLNVAFFAIGLGFLLVAVADFVRQTVYLGRERAGASLASYIMGAFFSLGLTEILTAIFETNFGITSVFVFVTANLLISGILFSLPPIKRLWSCDK